MLLLIKLITNIKLILVLKIIRLYLGKWHLILVKIYFT